ncbi:MAG: hypothetical protein ABJD68_08220 [Nakamurella sp.]
MKDSPPEQPAGTPVGPLAQEAAMLLDVVADRLEAMKRAPAAQRTNADTAAAEQGAAAGGQAAAADDDAMPGDATDAEAASAAPANSASACPECGSVPGAYCTACPLCRFMALLRGERPEATARLVDGALMIIRTLRSMVPEPGESAATAHQHPHDSSAATRPPGRNTHPSPPPARRTGLEHINIL